MALHRRSKRRLIFLLLVVLTLAAAGMAFQSLRSMQQHRLVAEARDRGMTAYSQRNFDACLKDFSYFFEHVKNDLEVNVAFARARAAIPIVGGRHLLESIDLLSNHGLKLIESVPALDPDGTKRHLVEQLLLDLYCRAGMQFEIGQTADRLIAVDQFNVPAIRAKAELLRMNGKFSEAEPWAQQLIELEPDNLRWRRMFLQILEASGATLAERLEQCDQWAAQSAKAEGADRDGRFQLLAAELLLNANQIDEARSRLEHVAQQGINGQEAFDRSVQLMDLLNLRADADQLVAMTIERDRQAAWPRETQALRLWHANRLDQCLDYIHGIEQERGELTPAMWRLMAVVHYCRGASTQALDDLKGFVSMLDAASSRRPLAHAFDAIDENDQGDSSDAANRAWATAVSLVINAGQSTWQERMDALQHANRLAPQDATLYSLMGDTWTSVGENSEAIRCYQRAYELEPDWQAAGLACANALLEANRFAEAHRISRLVISRASNDQPGPLLTFARTTFAVKKAQPFDAVWLLDQDSLPDLISVLDQIHRDNPRSADAAALLCEGLALSGQSDQAEQVINEIKQAPEAPAAELLALADVVGQFNATEQESLLVRAREIDGLTPQIAFRWADCKARQGDAAAGLQMIDDSLAANPSENDRLSWDCQRVRYLLEHRLPGATAAAEMLVQAHPASIVAQQLVLAYVGEWADSRVPELALAQLRAIVGESSPQVRLAQAQLLVQFHANDEPSLAKAIVELDGVLADDPDSFAALTLMAHASSLGDRPNLDRAIQCLERASSLYRHRPDLIIQLAALLQRQGDFTKAGQYLRILAQIAPSDSQSAPAELRLWRAQGDFESALARASHLVNEQSPISDQLIFALMEAHAGRRNEAEQSYERLLKAHPSNPTVLAQAADFFANAGDFDRGLQLMKQAANMPADESGTPPETMLGAFYLRHGRIEDAEQWLQKAVDQNPKSAIARCELAKCCLAKHDHHRARELALQGLQIDPADAHLRSLLAIASMNASPQERRDALAAMRDKRSGDDDLIAILEFLNRLPMRDGKIVPTDANLAAVKRLVDGHGHFLPAWQLAVSLHAETNHLNQAIALARGAVSRFPAEPEPSRWATELLMQSGQWQEALAEATEWRRRSLDQPASVDAVVASILLELNRPDEAVQQLRQYADVFWTNRQRFPERLAVWIRARTLAGHYEESAAMVRQLLSEDGRWTRFWQSLAMQLDDDHAASALDMLTANPGKGEDRWSLISAWIELAKRTGNERCLDRAESLVQSDPGAQSTTSFEHAMTRAAIAEARRQWDVAEREYRAALNVQPNQPVALNNLAFVISRDSNRCAESLSYVQQALHQQPDQPDFLDTLAQVLLGLNRIDEARSAAARAAMLRPDDPQLSLSLIEVRLHQDRLDGLESMFQDLRQKMQMERRPNRQVQERFESLWRQFEQSQAAAGT